MKLLFTLLLTSAFVFSFDFSYAEDEATTETKLQLAEQEADKAEVTPKVSKFKVNFDKTFYEFEGVRSANQYGPNGQSAYGFDRVTYDTNTMAFSYLYSPTLHYTVATGYNTIYAETKFYGVLYEDETEGLSDTTLKATKSFFQPSGIYIFEVGTLLPTGSIQEKNTTSPAAGDNYPYNMQLGSGTNDFVVDGMYIKPMGQHQIGAFAMATVRTGRNSQGYRKGDEYLAKTWYSYAVNPYFTPGVWVNYMNIQGIHGKDRTLDNPVVDQLLRFYYNPRSFWDVTANATAQYPMSSEVKLKGLLGLPLAQHGQNIDDIQLYTQWFAQLGVEGQF